MEPLILLFSTFSDVCPNGFITLTVAETDDKYMEPNRNLLSSVSVQCEQLHTILYNPLFVCLGLGLGHCQCDDSISFKIRGGSITLCAFSPTCNEFPMFTSGATPADPLTVSMTAEPF